DAFSSDAVPVHLMTAEALRLYLDKVKSDGIVLLHISNRYLDLDSVLGATIKALPGVHGILVSDYSADGSYAQSTSTVALFAKSEEALGPLRTLDGVAELDDNNLRAWTDDYSGILAPVLSKMKPPGEQCRRVRRRAALRVRWHQEKPRGSTHARRSSDRVQDCASGAHQDHRRRGQGARKGAHRDSRLGQAAR